MPTIRVHDDIGDLVDDLADIARRSRADMRDTVLDGIRAGNALAQDYARRKNGPRSHSRKYPGTFSAEMDRGKGLFGNVYSGEYGPRRSGQGMLAPILENGSRSGNAAQLNLARSTDVIFPQFAIEVGRLPSKWFWA